MTGRHQNISGMGLLLVVCALPAHAGLFALSSHTSEDSFHSTYRYSTKPSSEFHAQVSKHTGEYFENSSAYTYATWVTSMRITWADYEARSLDPDSADELIKQAYAMDGTMLQRFARELGVSSNYLARTIVKTLPPRLNRYQLQGLMRYIIPVFRADMDALLTAAG